MTKEQLAAAAEVCKRAKESYRALCDMVENMARTVEQQQNEVAELQAQIAIEKARRPYRDGEANE